MHQATFSESILVIYQHQSILIKIDSLFLPTIYVILQARAFDKDFCLLHPMRSYRHISHCKTDFILYLKHSQKYHSTIYIIIDKEITKADHVYSIPNYSFQNSDAVRVFMDKNATNIYMQISNKNSFISTHILFNLHVDLKHRVFQPKTKLVNDMYSDLKFNFRRPSNRRNI